MFLFTSYLCIAAALSVPSDTATKASLIQMGLARHVKVSRVEPPTTLPLNKQDVAWQEMGFASELRTRQDSHLARSQLLVPVVRDEVEAGQLTKKSAGQKRIKASFPDLSDSTASILSAKRRSTTPKRSAWAKVPSVVKASDS